MNTHIPALKRGDLIAIVAPAKAIEKEYVKFAQSFLEHKGYRVVIGKHTLGKHNYFSGTDEERKNDFQEALDNPEVKAILCARGGYGAVRIVDSIQWASQLRAPKWIIGFSDITVFHQRMQRFGIQSIHATMPLNFQENTSESMDTLLAAIEGKSYSIVSPSNPNNQLGNVTGQLVGGNLSILYSLLGTDDQINYKNTILFIEEVGEQLYAIDRMLFAFKKAGVFDQISGLIIGGMTSIKDTETPTGFSIEQCVLEHFNYSKIPICFEFPAGHINDNRALILGQEVALTVSENTTVLSFNQD